MKTIYETGTSKEEAIACLRAGAQARYLKRAGRFGWETKFIEVTTNGRVVRVIFENGVQQDYSVSTFCSTFGLHPIPVSHDPLDEVGEYIVWCPNGTHNPKVIHKTQRIAEAEAVRLTEQHRKTFLVMKCASVVKPICKSEIIRK
ncbi:hypothetical protein HOR54_gp25 [Vibrio phage Vp670]|uniref:Uncharacterized protein n=1 Tax=Vibrio phage Vp670 TaxID=1932890 RepID=A0A1L7DQ77_9CAUD|nr:hypothetical protein HOR54_gp25 [Vibrio phage Vp670]APU00162.1 hypothetical protein QD07_25 [Vibrio phage Vp670]